MSKRPIAPDHEAIGKVIPELRFMAGQYRSTPAAIDDLIELTLQTAVSELKNRPPDLPLTQWLRRIMARIVLH